jgi:hypothetical protein
MISDSDVRLRFIKKWGLISVTSLPRKTFKYARIQTMVLHLQKGYQGPTEFIVYDLLKKDNPWMTKEDSDILAEKFRKYNKL